MAAHTYNFRQRTPKVVAPGQGIPSGYTRLDVFNSTINKYGKYSGLSGQPVDESGIWVKEFNGRILLWWATPTKQIDDFVYTGDSQMDIDACNAATGGIVAGYTWHHTGHPAEESYGTMQLVPTNEHDKLPHVGGSAISKGKYA